MVREGSQPSSCLCRGRTIFSYQSRVEEDDVPVKGIPMFKLLFEIVVKDNKYCPIHTIKK